MADQAKKSVACRIYVSKNEQFLQCNVQLMPRYHIFEFILQFRLFYNLRCVSYIIYSTVGMGTNNNCPVYDRHLNQGCKTQKISIYIITFRIRLVLVIMRKSTFVLNLMMSLNLSKRECLFVSYCLVISKQWLEIISSSEVEKRNISYISWKY